MWISTLLILLKPDSQKHVWKRTSVQKLKAHCNTYPSIHLILSLNFPDLQWFGYCVCPRWKVWQDWGFNWISHLIALQIHKLRNCSHKGSPSQSCCSHPSSSSEPPSVFPLFVLTQTFAQVKSYQETALVINMQSSFQLSFYQLHPHAVTNPFAFIQRYFTQRRRGMWKISRHLPPIQSPPIPSGGSTA